MLKWLLRILIGVGVILGALFWWLMLSGSAAPRSAPDLFPIEEWRAAVNQSSLDARPTGIGMIEVMSGAFPSFVVQAGAFGDPVAMPMTSFQIDSPGGTIIVGGAVDGETAAHMAKQSGAPTNFDEAKYDELIAALMVADQIVITHEHLDHVMAIARHPNPAGIAAALWLNAPQKAALAGLATDGELPPELQVIPPRLTGQTQMISPGVIIAPAAGHTAGSQVVFVSLQDGREYLLVGDIVWNMQNIADLKTRPVLTQYVAFDPNEDRSAVKQQIRALHDLAAAEPDLILVPSHDGAHLQSLLSAGQLSDGFVAATAREP